MSVVQVSARIDSETKKKAQEVFAREGLDIATAIKMLMTKTANEQRIPLVLQGYEPILAVERKARLSGLLDKVMAENPPEHVDLTSNKETEGWDEY